MSGYAWAAEVSNYFSFLSARPFCAKADGSQTCTVVVAIIDTAGSPLNGKSVTLYSTRGNSDVIGPVNPATTNSAGQCTFTIKSSYSGDCTVTAVCDGKTINKGIIKTSAVGIWCFENNAIDISGNNNNGTLSGSPSYISGKSGSCLSFDGSNDYVSVPHSSSLSLYGSNGLTLEAWVYFPSAWSGARILEKSPAPDFDYAIFAGSDSAGYTHKNGAASCIAYSGSGSLSTGRWYHIVGVYEGKFEGTVENNFISDLDDGRGRIYVDTVMKNRGRVWRGGINRHSQPLNIGRAVDGTNYFKGYIDEIRIYNRILSDVEIKRNYNFSTALSFTLSPPSGVQADTTGIPEAIKIKWSSSGNQYLSSCRIYRSTSPGVVVSSENMVREANPHDTMFFDWDVTAGTRYYYVVTSVSFGNESAKSSEASAIPTQAVSAPGWYAGDFHCHTTHSDGSTSVATLVNNAKSRGLKFIFLSDHNSTGGRLEIEQASSASFLGVIGEEVTMTKHWNAFFIKNYIPSDGDVYDRVDDANAQGCLSSMNHPAGSYPSIPNWQGWEIWNSINQPATGTWDNYLKSGYRIVGLGGSDNHGGQPGTPTTYCYLERLSCKALYDAIQNCRAFVSNGPTLDFFINGKRIGDTVFVSSGEVVNISISCTTTANTQQIKLIKFGSTFKTYNTSSKNFTTTLSDTANTYTYYRIEINDANGKKALSNPIFIEISEETQGMGSSINSSYITFTPYQLPADNSSRCTVTVTANDTDGLSVAGKSVKLVTSRGTQDTINDSKGDSTNPQTTDVNGQCTFTIRSSQFGWDTITAGCDGSTITRGVNKYGAVGIWHLDRDAKDASGCGNNGTVNGATWTSGVYGSALSFDGTNDYVDCGNASSFNCTQALTIELWVKGEFNRSSWQEWVAKVAGSTQRSYYIRPEKNTGKAQLLFGYSETLKGLTSATVLNNWEWYHIAGTFDGSVMRVYVNGNLDNYTTVSSYTIPVTDTGILAIGRLGSVSSEYFNGSIDEVKVYSRALTADEIKASYNKNANIYFTSTASAKSLKFATAIFTITQNNPSSYIQVQACDTQGNVEATFNGTITLSSSSSSGKFSIDRLSWEDTTIITLTLGECIFYYKDSVIGNSVITAFCTGSFSPDSQVVAVVAQGVNQNVSFISFTPLGVTANNSSVCTVNVHINDTYGFPIQGKSVSIFSSRGGLDTIIGNPQVTDAEGRCTFTVKSSNAGDATLTASCDGKTIARGVSKYGAVGIWNFDRDLKDGSLCTNNGTAPKPLWTDGSNNAKFGGALQCDGTSDRAVMVPDSPSLRFGNSDFTIECWVKPSVFDIERYIINKNNWPTAIWAVSIRPEGRVQMGLIDEDQNLGTTYSVSSLILNSWNHLVVTVDRKNYQTGYYINGVYSSQEIPGTFQGALDLTGTNVYVSGDWQRLVGCIDEIKIYNRVLSAEEVASSYQGNAKIYFTATNLKISTPVRSAAVEIPSNYITVEAQDGSGGLDVINNDTIIFSTSSPTGKFSISNIEWSDVNVVSLSNGSGNFYYMDTQVGTYTITVTRAGLVSDTQIIKIRPEMIPPFPPIGLRVMISGNNVVLVWRPVAKNSDGTNCTDLLKYAIYRKIAGGMPISESDKIAEVSASDTTYIDTNAAGNTIYYYVVKAVDADGNMSRHSHEVDNRENIYIRRTDFQESGDTLTLVRIPKEVVFAIFKENNSFKKDIRIEVDSLPETSSLRTKPGIVSAFEFKTYSGDTQEEVSSFSFPHKVELVIKYEVEDGYIKNTSIPVSLAKSKLGICWWNGLEWIKLGGTINETAQTISILTDHLSTYAIMSTRNATKLTLTNRFPAIISPNGDNINDICFFFYENPNNKDITGRIYDLSGSLIVSQLPAGPVTNSLKWDGKDDYGNTVESGIYIYQLQGGDELISGTVVVAK